jgi:hypothetical protein
MNAVQEKMVERMQHRIAGDYFEHYSIRPIQHPKFGQVSNDPNELIMYANSALSSLDSAIRDGILLLTRVSIGNQPPLSEGAMAVALNNKTETIALFVNLHHLDILVDMAKSGELPSPTSAIISELQFMFLHELWHVLRGHNYLPPHIASDYIWRIALEIGINNGNLASRIGQVAYPAVTLDSLHIRKAAEEAAKKLNMPEDWLLDDHMVYRVISSLFEREQIRVIYTNCCCLLEDTDNDKGTKEPEEVCPQCGQKHQHGHLVVILENTKTKQRTVLHPWQLAGDSRQAGSEEDVDRVHRNILQNTDPNWIYDPVKRSFRYSNDPPSEANRIIKPKATIIPWAKIRTILRVSRSLGYNRRIGHSLPPDMQKLVTHKPKIKERIAVFIDSSGSISDEIISTFIGIVKTSPCQVDVKYFSTEIRNEPHTGGTDFKCIEDYLLSQDRYPHAVLVLTDGYAPVNFTPKYPKRWWWVVLGDPSVPQKIGGNILMAKEVGG